MLQEVSSEDLNQVNSFETSKWIDKKAVLKPNGVSTSHIECE